MKICGNELLLCVVPVQCYEYSRTKLVIMKPFGVFLRFKNSAWDFFRFNFGSGDF